jgi:hypothetical protein
LKSIRRHGATASLAVLVVLPILIRGGTPPSKPCTSGWDETKDSCGNTESWHCRDTNETIFESYQPIVFEGNAGQIASPYQFLTRSGPLGVFLTAGTAVLDLRGPDGAPSVIRIGLDGAIRQTRIDRRTNSCRPRWAYRCPACGCGR